MLQISVYTEEGKQESGACRASAEGLAGAESGGECLERGEEAERRPGRAR